MFQCTFIEEVRKNTCCLTHVNFITEDRMPRYTQLNENRLFTNKMRLSIIWERKG